MRSPITDFQCQRKKRLIFENDAVDLLHLNGLHRQYLDIIAMPRKKKILITRYLLYIGTKCELPRKQFPSLNCNLDSRLEKQPIVMTPSFILKMPIVFSDRRTTERNIRQMTTFIRTTKQQVHCKIGLLLKLTSMVIRVVNIIIET